MARDDYKDINLRSEEVEELMGEVPPLILRMGIGLLFVITIIAIALSAIITYPEQIELRGELAGKEHLHQGGNDCQGTYICHAGLRQKERMAVGMPAAIVTEDFSLTGKVVWVDSLYNKSTGLFCIKVIASTSKKDIPLLLQHAKEATIHIDVSSRTVLEQLIGRNFRTVK